MKISKIKLKIFKISFQNYYHNKNFENLLPWKLPALYGIWPFSDYCINNISYTRPMKQYEMVKNFCKWPTFVVKVFGHLSVYIPFLILIYEIAIFTSKSILPHGRSLECYWLRKPQSFLYISNIFTKPQKILPENLCRHYADVVSEQVITCIILIGKYYL